MTEAPLIPAGTFLDEALSFRQGEGPFACLDVRSEGEFRSGSLPGFVNFPVLRDAERHQVGLTYKSRGQAEAVRLGHELVSGGEREARIERWGAAISASPAKRGYVVCWRGGLRSRIACEWIEARGASVSRIQGGYKALRGSLLSPFLRERLSEDDPAIRVITGLTGAGKTELLRKCASRGVAVIDLEGHARHRGSSFGLRPGDEQPSQASFENAVAWDYRRYLKEGRNGVWVEDESRAIGKVLLPGALRGAMDGARVVVLEAPLEQRAGRLHEEYVRAPLRGGIEPSRLGDALGGSVLAIRRRLGGALAQDCLRQIEEAFRERDFSLERHRGWIEKLLVHYYDRAYRHSIERNARETLFQGDADSCLGWIMERGSD